MTGSEPIFDTHAHFFTDDIARYPVDVTGTGEGEAVLMRRIAADPATPERVFPQWDACGIRAGAAVQYNSVYKADNRYCIDMADAHPARLSAVLMLPAAAPDTPALLRGLVLDHNIRGLRLHGMPEGDGSCLWLDSPPALKTWEAAAALGLPMVVMYAPGTPSEAVLARIAALARRFPETAICLDHFGWTLDDAHPERALSPAHRALACIANIHFKFTQINLIRFAAPGTDAAAFLRHAVDVFGPDRILWGSDHGNASRHAGIDYPAMVQGARAAAAALSPIERACFLHDNGSRLFRPNGSHAAGIKASASAWI